MNTPFSLTFHVSTTQNENEPFTVTVKRILTASRNLQAYGLTIEKVDVDTSGFGEALLERLKTSVLPVKALQ
jgi:hypothetical protein